MLTARPAQHEYAPAFRRFALLAMLHLHGAAKRRPQASQMSDREFAQQTDAWLAAARHVARALPSVDFVGWHGEHFVVVRARGARAELKELPVRRRLDCGKGVDLGTEDAMWMERKDVPIDYERSGLET